jgi:hypothetical protein
MRFARLCAVKRDFRAVSTRGTILYLAFAAILSSTCYFRPVPDDFDRYIYEALVRGRYQSVETIYPIIKHENPRAENSSVLDSPTHLRQLEPLYAIRPTYVDAIAMFSRVGIPVQRSINLVSAVSFFGIAIVLLAFTRSPFYSANACGSCNRTVGHARCFVHSATDYRVLGADARPFPRRRRINDFVGMGPHRQCSPRYRGTRRAGLEAKTFRLARFVVRSGGAGKRSIHQSYGRQLWLDCSFSLQFCWREISR